MFEDLKENLRHRIKDGTLEKEEAGQWLYEFVTNGDVEMVAELLKIPGTPQYAGLGGVSPLHQAVRANYDADTKLQIAALLVKHGADTNFQDDYGYTPLHYAGFYGVPEICRFLVQKGGRLDAHDRRGESPLHWATRATNAGPVVAELLKLGADVTLKNRYGLTPVQVARYELRMEAYAVLQRHISTRHARKVKRLGLGRPRRPGM